LKKEHRYHCNGCNTSFSVTVGTIFHKTHLAAQKWLLAVSLILNAKKGISARQLARHLKVNRNTAWRIAMKIRDAMYEPEQRNLLQGIVEMDETWIGGRPRKKHPGDKHPRGSGTDKTPVVGIAERYGNVKAKPFLKSNLTTKKLMSLVRESVDTKRSVLVTDQAHHYWRMGKLIPHYDVNHQVWYTDGWKHTNTIECFWALLKRGIVGQFHKVTAKHLHKYINEFAYRFNNRDNKDVFTLTLNKGLGVA
jgi:transposase-like protein